MPTLSGFDVSFRDESPGTSGFTYGSWVNLTTNITTAIAGGLDADPDSEGASLTCTTTTGTFNGETVDCNQFGWTAHASTNDGYSEMMYVSLGLVSSVISDYDADEYGWEIVADMVDYGTPGSIQPILFVGVDVGGGAIGTRIQGAGWEYTSATTPAGTRNLTSIANQTHGLIGSADENQIVTTKLWNYNSTASLYLTDFSDDLDRAVYDDYISVASTTLDELYVFMGQDTSTGGAISGLKIRFRIRSVKLTANPVIATETVL